MNNLDALSTECESLSDWDLPQNDQAIRNAATALQNELTSSISSDTSDELSATSDTPLFIRLADLQNPSFINRENPEDAGRIEKNNIIARSSKSPK